MADPRSEKEIELLKKLEELLSRDPRFNAEEVELIREVLEAFRGLRWMGRFMRWAVLGLAALAAVFTAGETVMSKIRGVLGQ